MALHAMDKYARICILIHKQRNTIFLTIMEKLRNHIMNNRDLSSLNAPETLTNGTNYPTLQRFSRRPLELGFLFHLANGW